MVYNKKQYFCSGKFVLYMKSNIIEIKSYLLPYGEVILGSFENRLCLCDWITGKHHKQVKNRLSRNLQAEFKAGNSILIENAVQQLEEYFAKERKVFDVPLLLVGSDFQKRVWQKLYSIPFGTTISYKELSQKIGSPKAVRAVANAVGANSISIFLPCHRVIGSNKSLTGYAGGLAVKQKLLELENTAF